MVQLKIAQMDRDEEEARNVISHFKMIVVELLVLNLIILF